MQLLDTSCFYKLTETAKANGLYILLYLETVMIKTLSYKNEPDSIVEKIMSCQKQ